MSYFPRLPFSIADEINNLIQPSVQSMLHNQYRYEHSLLPEIMAQQLLREQIERSMLPLGGQIDVVRAEALRRLHFEELSITHGTSLRAPYGTQRLAEQLVHLTPSELTSLEESLARVTQALPPSLQDYATSLSHVGHWVRMEQLVGRYDPFARVGAFADASAAANMLFEATRVDRDLVLGVQDFVSRPLPEIVSLDDYRRLLDLSGITLPRWPRVRWLSEKERRRRFDARIAAHTEPPHRRKAKALIERYEHVLIQIIDEVMAAEYGDDWVEHRLPVCGCKKLLGMQRARGGHALQYADYTHYALIISDLAHFERVFGDAFESPEIVTMLFKKAGDLRAASHHPRPFTAADLRELRTTWLTIRAGLIALESDFELEWG